MGWSKRDKQERREKRIKDRQAATEVTSAKIVEQKTATQNELAPTTSIPNTPIRRFLLPRPPEPRGSWGGTGRR
jgi:hypothetical protein